MDMVDGSVAGVVTFLFRDCKQGKKSKRNDDLRARINLLDNLPIPPRNLGNLPLKAKHFAKDEQIVTYI